MKLPKLNPVSPDKLLNFSVTTSWGIRDPARFHALIAEAMKLVSPGYHVGDNLVTWGKNNSALEDGLFRQAWESNLRSEADRAMVWRRYVLACAGYHCTQLPGDFVECGVLYGTGIKTVVDYLGGARFTKTFWGYDAFEFSQVDGAPADKQGDFLAEVRKRFEGYPKVKLVKGMVPASLRRAPRRICYLHLDLNQVEAEVAALERLFDRVVTGGLVVLDDYEWSGKYRPQKIAEDAWFEARSYRVFPLPTGQGLVLKR
ncbi:MAG: TylF/MycF/NovP-related O-methyltransferase [Pseudomonadota bacterium]